MSDGIKKLQADSQGAEGAAGMLELVGDLEEAGALEPSASATNSSIFIGAVRLRSSRSR